MITVDATFRDRYGLHPRAAMRIQQAAAGFRSKTTLQGLDTGTAPIPAGTMIGLVSAGSLNHVARAVQSDDVRLRPAREPAPRPVRPESQRRPG